MLRGGVLQRGHLVAIAAGANPLLAQRRQALADLVVLRPAGIVNEERLAVGEVDFPHRHADALGDFDVDPLDSRVRIGFRIAWRRGWGFGRLGILPGRFACDGCFDDGHDGPPAMEMTTQ